MKALPSFDYLYGGPSLNSLLSGFLPDDLREPPLDGIDCNGFLTGDELAGLEALLENELVAAPVLLGGLLDLGCGTGGLARHFARRFGCPVIGIDASARAIARARAASEQVGVDFRVADFAATSLPAGSMAAAVSLDALYLAVDVRAALVEVRRVLVPGGLVVFTIYCSRASFDARRPEAWRALAAVAGLGFESCRDLTPRWRAVMLCKHEARWRARDEVTRVLGRRADSELAVSAAMLGVGGPSFLDETERYELRMRRPAAADGG